MGTENKLLNLIIRTLDKKKAENVTLLNVKAFTQITDCFIIVTATSKRHAKALLRHLLNHTKEQLNIKPYGVEGEEDGEWILVDFLSTVVHIMQKETREFYNLESLWHMTKNSRDGDSAEKRNTGLTG
jgi:ribosome-associated protein